ncbi:MAG: response regulator [Melioribacteraceae bacterium]
MKEHKNILIIDDEQVVIDSISKIAMMGDYSYETVMDAQSALEKISGEDFDLIICDIMLPGMDGFQFLSAIESKRIDTPVIMTTGFSTIENAVKSLYSGAIEFVPKPFTVDELTSVIHRGMKYSALHRMRKLKEDSVLIVPCPAKYLRLGYSAWMNLDFDGSVLIGATDFFIKTLEQIRKIELLPINEILTQASSAVKFETEDGLVHQLYSVISGTIIEINERLLNEPELLEKDPYFEGWIYRIIPSELAYEIKLLIPCSSDRT